MKTDTIQTRKWITTCLMALLTFCLVLTGIFFIAPIEAEAASNTERYTAHEQAQTLSGTYTLGTSTTSTYGWVVPANTTVTINGNNLTVSKQEGNGYPLYMLERGATLIINDLTIVGIEESNYAPLIVTSPYSTVTLNGCTLMNNTNYYSTYRTSGLGGGVYIAANSSFTLNNSTIEQCYVYGNIEPSYGETYDVFGGGIYNEGLLSVKGTSEFVCCDAGAYNGNYYIEYGGGIYQAESATYTNNNGTTSTYSPRMYISGTCLFQACGADKGNAIYIAGGQEAYIGTNDGNILFQYGNGSAIYAGETTNGTHIYGDVDFINVGKNYCGSTVYADGVVYIGMQGTDRVTFNDNYVLYGTIHCTKNGSVYLGKVDITANHNYSAYIYGQGTYYYDCHAGIYVDGGNVYVSSELVVKDNVSFNEAGETVGAIEIRNGGTLHMSSWPYVSGNTTENEEGVYDSLDINCVDGTINITGPLTENADSGITTVPANIYVSNLDTAFTSGWSNANVDIDDVFVSTRDGVGIFENESGELYASNIYEIRLIHSEDLILPSIVEAHTLTWADTSSYIPNKTGYTFKGWTTTQGDESTLVLSSSVTSYTPTSDVTLYGLWEVNTYDITYSLNSGAVEGWTPTNFTATYGESYMLVPSTTPTRSGYTFTGWTMTYYGLNNGAALGNITIVLPEEYIGATVPFEEPDGITQASITITANWKARTATSISVPVKLQTQSYVVGDALKSIKITVTYDNGETEKVAVTPEMVTNFSTENATVLWKTATVAYEGLTTTFQYKVSTGYAYTVEHHKENIDDDGYTLVSADTENLAGVGTTNAVAKTYTGFTAQSFEQQAIAEDGSTVVKIYYKRNIYTLTYDLDGGTIEGQTEFTAKYGQTISPNNATPTKQGFRFVEYVFLVNTNNGWEVLGTAKANDDVWFGYAHNLKLQASWEERQIESISIPAVSQNQSYVVDGAFVPFNITVTYDNGETESVEVTEAMLSGFSTESAVDNATATVTYTEGEVTKTATFTYSVTNGYAYTVKHYQENLNDDGYTLKDTQTLYGVGTTNAAALTYEGFTAQAFEQTTIAEDGSTIVEIYYDRNTYTIEVNLDGGTLSGANDITVKFGETYRLPSGTPTKAEYTFGGWKIYIDGEVYINASVGSLWFSVGIPMDKAPEDTIEARVTWNEREISDMQLNVTNTTYEVGDEFRPFNMTVVYDNGETETVQVTAEMLTDFSTATVTNLTAACVHYEGASKIMTYKVVEKTNTVSFNIGGGTGTAPQSLDATVGASVTLPSADGLTKTGYTFGGWSDGTNTYEAGASYTPSDDISLTAVWKLKAPTITINGVEPLEGDDKADYVLAFTYDGNAHNITLNGSHELGNAVTYEYYMIKYTANSANPDMDSLPPWALITDTTQSFTNVSDSNYYLCVVKTTLDDETTAAYTIIKVDISKADQTITLSEDEFTYSEGLTIDFADYVSGTGDGTLSYAASAQNGVTFDFANGVVSNITKAGGTFTLTVNKAASDNYNAATETFTVTLNKGAQTLSVSGSPNPPTWKQEYQVSVSGNKGALSYAIISGNATVNESGVITATGTGQIRYSVTAAATNLYEAVTVERTVTFGKAEGKLAPDYATSKPTNLTICVGKTTDNITLPTGWSFASKTTFGQVGNITVSVTFTPSDTANYNSITENIVIAVADHTGGTAASCTTDQVCTKCGTVLVEALDHDFENQPWTNLGESGHAHQCSRCDVYDEIIPHYSEDEATCTSAKLCDACDYEMEAQKDHSFTEQIEDEAHLKEEGTDCVTGATYWYDCATCTMISTEDYWTADAQGNHNFDEDGFCTLCDAVEAPYYNENRDINGDGTPDGAYEVSKVGHLYWFSSDYGEYKYIDGNVFLMNDIVVNENVLLEDGSLNASAVESFRIWKLLIGLDTDYVFDGNGKFISGLYLINYDINIGIGGLLCDNDGIIKNLTVKNSYLEGYEFSSIVHYNGGIVENCHSVNNTLVSKYGGGGVVGINYGTIKDCTNSSNLYVENGLDDETIEIFLGGIVAIVNEGEVIKNCVNYGTITATANSSEYINVGGIIGGNNYEGIVEITNCHNKGNIIVQSIAPAVGGVVGFGVYNRISDCTNTGNITVDANYDEAVGGIVGASSSSVTIERCYNAGDIEINAGSFGYSVAGIAGWTMTTTIVNSYNVGNIEVTFDENFDENNAERMATSGIANIDTSLVCNCYNAGEIIIPAEYQSTLIYGGVILLDDNDTSSLIENNYYLNATANEYGGRTAEQFASGEVAYALCKQIVIDEEFTIDGSAWGQTIGTDLTPVFDGDKVYAISHCANNATLYANDQSAVYILTKTDAKESTCQVQGNNAYWTCSICNKVYADENCTIVTSVEDSKLDLADHNWSATWDYEDEDGHAHKCLTPGCNEISTLEYHIEGAPATEDDPQLCTECGYVITPATGHVNHVSRGEYGYDENSHWFKCTGCDTYKIDQTAHQFDNACDVDCICGYQRTIEHDYTELKFNDTHHWYECSVCGSEKANSRVAHSGGTKDCQHKAECATCGQTYGDFGDHAYDTTVWVSVDNEHHAHKCMLCDAYTDETEHFSLDEATYTEDKLCDACGHKMADALGFELNNVVYKILTNEEGNYTVEVYGNTLTEATEVIIPAKVNDEGIEYTVVSIGEDAFRNSTYLTGVTICEGVGSIAKSAFENCNALLYAELPQSIYAIGIGAFCNCSELRMVNIPYTVNVIEEWTFNGCHKLENIEIHESIIKIGYRAFYNCYTLPSVVIPYSVETLDKNAFYGCTGLEEMRIYSMKVAIGENAIPTDIPAVYCEGAESTAAKYCAENGISFQTHEGEHADKDKNHICDYGCSEALGVCEDNNFDHNCDYGCEKTYGEHSDGDDNNHLCDYGCQKIADDGCYDTVVDGKCDECGENIIHDCKDDNKNHECDICGTAIGNHSDSITDKDHLCDYGCGAVMENCVPNADDGDCTTDIICSICGAITTEGAASHIGGNATCTEKAECTVCGKEYGELEPHSHGSEWKNDADEHWNECECGDKANKAAHVDSDSNGACDTCGYALGTTPPSHTHAHGSTWVTDANEHWNECECGDKANKAAHVDSDSNGACDTCGYAMGTTPPPHTHSHGSTWVTDANEHWNECECGDKANKAAHFDSDSNGACDTCGYAMGTTPPPHTHSHGSAWVTDANEHWNECECGDKANKAAHVDSDSNGACDTCGYAMGTTPPPHTHSHGSTWVTDANEHWNECECGDKANKAAHVDDNGDNKCDTCDYTMPAHDPDTPPVDNPPTDDNDGLGTGAVIGIVVAAVAVVGGGGFALFWFVIRKKRGF